MGRIAITGIGPVTPIGFGKEQFWNAVENRHSGIKPLTKFSLQHDARCGEISGSSLEDYTTDSRFRRAADISRYALIAAALAVNDAGYHSIRGSDTSLIVGMTHGALCYTQKFHGALIKEGVDAISPIHFSDSVLNASAGNSSICFGIKGPAHTLVGGPETGLKALALACEMLGRGASARSLVLSAEELNELTLSCYRRMGSLPLAEGAGALLLEREEDISEGRVPYCYISSAISLCAPADPYAPAREVIESCLEKAELSSHDIELFVSDRNAPACVFPEETPCGGLVHLTGNAFSAATLWHVIAASLAIGKGTIPGAFIQNKMPAPGRIDNVMVFASDRHVASAIILSRYSRK